MRVSNSKIGSLLSCPRKFKLSYIDGLSPISKSKALKIGEAVHWGIENNTSNLDPFFSKGSFRQSQEYTDEQYIAEAMVYGYLKNKDKIFEPYKKYNIIEEIHELDLLVDLKSKIFHKSHELNGIIDLLYLTEEGWIIIDFKTSSQTPDYDQFLPQIYTYIYLIQQRFGTDIPILDIGIVNIRKSGIRLRSKETPEEFRLRLKREYELNAENYLSLFRYDPSNLDQEAIDDFVSNLTDQADYIEAVVQLDMFPKNLGSCNNYGGCEFLPICTKQAGALNLFKKWGK